MTPSEKKQQKITFFITSIMRLFLSLAIVFSYIGMISYLIYYSDYYRLIGTITFYIPLILFSLPPILFFGKSWRPVMGVAFSLALLLYFYSNAFFSQASLGVPYLQLHSVVNTVFYIGMFLYLCYFSLFILLWIIGTIHNKGEMTAKNLAITIFLMVYIFISIVVVLGFMVTKNTIGAAL